MKKDQKMTWADTFAHWHGWTVSPCDGLCAHLEYVFAGTVASSKSRGDKATRRIRHVRQALLGVRCWTAQVVKMTPVI